MSEQISTRFLTEREVAQILRVSVHALRRWRREGGGPTYLKIGASVRYSLDRLKIYLETCETGGGRAA